MKYNNPIISGYNPDPSICRVGEDYYIANSSFEYFPGVPVYHSKNLVNWELISYCLTDKEQLDLHKARSSGGIYAPMLCYHDSTFFMTTTNVTGKGHLIVHTKDIRKGWSKPVWVNQDGIDPTLFFDDGKVYFASTSFDDDGRQGIFMCEIDPYTGEKLTESVCISYGCGGSCPEGPHLYKWFGKYYLLMAEGGTEYGHMVTLQRADSVYGPYEACPHNPILSHRYDSVRDISCTGHADIMQDHNGNWWLVCLGTRSSGERGRHLLLHHLGRETFLSPVVWNEDGWPVVGNNGTIALEMEGELPCGEIVPVSHDFADDFSKKEFSLHYNFLRNPFMENYVRDTQSKTLLLNGTEVTLNDVDSPTWLGIRQKGFETVTDVSVKIEDVREGNRAGLTAFYNDSYHYEIYVTKDGSSRKVCLAKHVHDIFAVTASVDISDTDIKSSSDAGIADDNDKWINLRMTSDRDHYYFYYANEDNKEYKLLGTAVTVGLATETTMTMTFTGTYIGMFAENGKGIFKDFSVRVMD